MRGKRVSNTDRSASALSVEEAAERIIAARDRHGVPCLQESPPVRALFSSLDRLEARYCHWKSNIRLDATLAGDEDIDVLVHPFDAHLLLSAMVENRYKLQFPRRGTGHPAVFHALALDEPSAKLVDLHAYHQLVSGDSLVKLFRFPVEERLLATTTRQAGVTVPAPSAELVLYLLRIMLKHSRVAEALKVNEKYGPIRHELSWLLERSDVAEAEAICRGWFPTLSVSVPEMIAATMDRTRILRRSILGLRIARDLRHLKRLDPIAAQASHFRQVMREVIKRAGLLLSLPVRQSSSRSLVSGGAWIAFAGPKGVGKSTLAKLIVKRLGRYLDVELIHVGKPPKTLASLMAAPLVAVAWRLFRADSLNDFEKQEKRDERNYPLLYIVHKLLLARDRRRLLTRAMRSVTAGSIIISDRCPVTNFTGIDGSVFDDRAVELARSRLHRWLMEKERHIYCGLPTPRMVLRLMADMETALRRNRERPNPRRSNGEAIQRRWDWENRVEFEGSAIAVIDARGTLEETLRQCMRQTWESL